MVALSYLPWLRVSKFGEQKDFCKILCNSELWLISVYQDTDLINFDFAYGFEERIGTNFNLTKSDTLESKICLSENKIYLFIIWWIINIQEIFCAFLFFENFLNKLNLLLTLSGKAGSFWNTTKYFKGEHRFVLQLCNNDVKNICQNHNFVVAFFVRNQIWVFEGKKKRIYRSLDVHFGSIFTKLITQVFVSKNSGSLMRILDNKLFALGLQL